MTWLSDSMLDGRSLRRDDEPHLADALPVRVAGRRVARVGVERMARDGDLRRAVCPLRRSELPGDSVTGLRRPRRGHRRPGLCTTPRTGAGGVPVLEEQVERASLRVREDGAERRVLRLDLRLP